MTTISAATAPTSAAPSSVDEVTYEAYRIWRRNCSALYDMCITHVLVYPTLALDMQPYVTAGTDHASVGFVIGTHTPTTDAEQERNHLYVKELALPLASQTVDPDSILKRDEGVIVGGYGSAPSPKLGSFHDRHWIEFPSEANAISCCPHEQNLIAAFSNDAVLLYDLRTLRRCSIEKEDSEPVARLTGLKTEGFSLEFSVTREAFLAGGDGEGNVCWWDCKEMKQLGGSRLSGDVNGISIHSFCPQVILAASDTGEIALLDTRVNNPVKTYKYSALVGEDKGSVPTAIACSRHDEYALTVADSAGQLVLVDMRQMSAPLKAMQYHTGAIYQLRWSPFYPGYVLTGSEDSRVVLWDLTRTSARKTCGDQDSTIPPEVCFVHGGHTTFVSAVCWHPSIPNLIGSAAEDNSLQFWWPAAGYLDI
ncbi:Histone acetyltransferase type B subunit 2 [Giardia muris]|uniref:Histone acetyltransferase type B subunit 2 n=1 Tax=Giardia muris TaxID=5742 RepID=A0A4Z1SNQ9_GIAMU|nr:Histone acetyltransferase type B subunit 2 [Giardia muris]|eukprot:TNJ27406.1 Histone acetyltransferase type B subunit 2 [Giardia muris]